MWKEIEKKERNLIDGKCYIYFVKYLLSNFRVSDTANVVHVPVLRPEKELQESTTPLCSPHDSLPSRLMNMKC